MTNSTITPETFTYFVTYEKHSDGQPTNWRKSEGDTPVGAIKQLQDWLDNDGQKHIIPVSTIRLIVVYTWTATDGHQEVCRFKGPACIYQAAEWLKTHIA